MRSEEWRPPLPAQAAEHRFHRHARHRVKAAHRLIEHVKVALEAEARRETELLRHAFRERAHRPLERLALELELRGESADPRLVVALAAERREHAQEFRAGQVMRRHEAFREISEARSRRGLRRRHAEDLDAPALASAEIEDRKS